MQGTCQIQLIQVVAAVIRQGDAKAVHRLLAGSRGNFGLRYRERRVGQFVREIGARADYDDVAEPLGNTTHTQRAGAAGVGVVLSPARRALPYAALMT